MQQIMYIHRITAIVFLLMLIFAVSHSPAFVTEKEEHSDSKKYFNGKWQTESGSSYEYVAGAMICVSVHNERFIGWINQVSIKNIRLKNEKWIADQAIRIHATGKLDRWMIATINIIDKNTFIKTIICSENERPNMCGPQVWKRTK